MESKLVDVEKDKTMLELELNETISRNKTEITEKISRLQQTEQKVVILQSKLEKKNDETDELWNAIEHEKAGEWFYRGPINKSLRQFICF